MAGRVVVALPEYILSNKYYRELRWRLLSDYSLDAVISLPDGAFVPSAEKERDVSSCSVALLFHLSTLSKSQTRLGGNCPSSQMQSKPNLTTNHPKTRLFPVSKLGTFRCPTSSKENIVWTEGKPGKIGPLDDMLDSIRVLVPSMEVKNLKDVAEVAQGLEYDETFTTEQSNEPGAIAGLLNVTDINQTVVRQPSLFLTEEGKNELSEDDIRRFAEIALRPDDIVIHDSRPSRKNRPYF